MFLNKFKLVLLFIIGAFLFCGCSARQKIGPDSDKQYDGLAGLYESGNPPQVGTDGQTDRVGVITEPIINTQPTTVTGQRIPTTLTNYHPGWGQEGCFVCHSESAQIPDHSYIDISLCSSCHGSNGVDTAYGGLTPSISGIQVMNYTDKVIITWKTNKPTTAKIFFGTLDANEFMKVVHSDFRTDHSVTLEGLSANTAYLYRIENRDQNNQVANSATFGSLSFSTKSSTSTTPIIPPGGDTGTPTELTWKTGIDKIFQRRCIDCHDQNKQGDDRKGAPLFIDYDEYARFQLAEERLKNKGTKTLDRIFPATENKVMPPKTSPPLSDLEKTNLKTWLEKDPPPFDVK
ncbi:fibronectin type III domain-containing protein [Candidatus Riflebacteria bacterium]